jgi:hypothetical protein
MRARSGSDPAGGALGPEPVDPASFELSDSDKSLAIETAERLQALAVCQALVQQALPGSVEFLADELRRLLACETLNQSAREEVERLAVLIAELRAARTGGAGTRHSTH